MSERVFAEKLFSEEEDARQYLENRVPTEEEPEVDLESLKQRIFEIPEEVKPGHFEFEGEGGFKISYDVKEDKYGFDQCWVVFKDLVGDEDDDPAFLGEMKPIYTIENLSIQTDGFSYSESDHSRDVSITWMPNLKSNRSELSHSQSFIDKGEIYLIGESGYLSRALDLLGYFHELGHIETRTPQELVDERNSVKKTYGPNGFETEPMKDAALELQRERDANAWMLNKTKGLFKDLDVDPENIGEYVHNAQLGSYQAVNRWRLENDKDAKE
jgi:hypothetical protein